METELLFCLTIMLEFIFTLMTGKFQPVTLRGLFQKWVDQKRSIWSPKHSGTAAAGEILAEPREGCSESQGSQ